MSQFKHIAILITVAALALVSWISPQPARSSAASAPETVAATSVSGRVFYDLDLNGAFNQDSYGMDEPGVYEAQVTLRNAQGSDVQTLTIGDDIGVFTFGDVAPGSYTVVETDTLDKVSTTPNPVAITVGDAPVVDVNFGLVLKLTVTGRVYTDVDENGAYYSSTDIALADATVKIVDDLDRNGIWNAGEPTLGTDVADQYGLFAIPSIAPGVRILAVEPAEIGGVEIAPVPVTLRASTLGAIRLGDIAVKASTPVGLTGIVWNDLDGDELAETGEPGLAGVQVEVYGAVSGITAGDPPLATAISGADGRYTISGLVAGWPYEITASAATLPAGWLRSTADPLLVTPDGTAEANFGYYDPLAVMPMRQGDWKKELRQAGKPRYTPAAVDGFIAAAEGASGVFAEAVGIRAVLLNQDSPVNGELAQALKEFAALRLNLASGRLFSATAVNLPELTTAQTVGAVVAEMEDFLAPNRTPTPTQADLQRLRRLAEMVNSGKGLGSGLPGAFKLSVATYRGASITTKLLPGGDLLDLGTDVPAYLAKWSPGLLNSATNVFAPQLRVKVKVFMEGAVLDVVQVLPNGGTATLGTIVPPVWNKDLNATYVFDLRGVSTVGELTRAEIRLIVRDVVIEGKAGKARIDSADLTFTY